MTFKKNLKKIKIIRICYAYYVSSKAFINIDVVAYIKKFVCFRSQYQKFKALGNNENFLEYELYPCLLDDTKDTQMDPTYFYQDTWAARKIFELQPEYHYDIGSSVSTIGILSQFVPIKMVDIRPLPLKLEGLDFVKGNILSLPFEDSSIESISSLCVVEHIGLGRYGDDLDPFGSEKAITELKRVTQPNGVILFSVPVDRVNTVYFNAHRAFTRNYILSLFSGFNLVEEKYIYGNSMYENYDSNKGFGTGLFLLRKSTA